MAVEVFQKARLEEKYHIAAMPYVDLRTVIHFERNL